MPEAQAPVARRAPWHPTLFAPLFGQRETHLCTAEKQDMEVILTAGDGKGCDGG